MANQVSGQFLAGFWPVFGQFMASLWPVLAPKNVANATFLEAKFWPLMPVWPRFICQFGFGFFASFASIFASLASLVQKFRKNSSEKN